jgi:tetratricopeptide (TPR) repeat protein
LNIVANDLKRSPLLAIAVFFALAAVVALGLRLRFKPYHPHDFFERRPPGENRYLFDDAGILEDAAESTNQALQNIKARFAIEALIVTLPALPPSSTIQTLSAELFSNWQIGKTTGGRGLLVLLSAKEMLAKIEVSYELEDVFTDVFCGYIEDKQLKAYFLSDQVNLGMIAVLEEIEARAQMKHQKHYTAADIEAMDHRLLSGGAGAKRRLTEYAKEEIKPVGENYPAGQSPAEAWQTLIRAWRNKVRDPNLGVYTEITKLAYRDFQNLPDSRYQEDVLAYKNKPFEVIGNDNYAVIFFGTKSGWQNAPFLFCKTKAGWQFDIVDQRKYVRMGRNPNWGIERANNPYAELLSRCPYWMNQDIPLEAEDIYRIENDRTLAAEIRRLESAHENNPDDFDTVIRLAKLYTICSLRPPKNISLLKKAKRLNPDSPGPYKYLGIVHLDAFYQFESAVKEIETYVRRKPDDVFGRNYLGYLYYCLKRYDQAGKELEKAVQLRPDNCYAYAKLARTYAQSYLQALPLDPRREGYRRQAVEMFAKAAATPTPDAVRIKWLQTFLTRKGIFE